MPSALAPGRPFLRRLAAHAGLRFATLDPERSDEPDFVAIDPLAARLLPEELCRRHRMVGVALAEGELEVAVADPFDAGAHAAARALAGRPIRLLLASEEDLQRALDEVYGARAPGPGQRPLLGELLVARELAHPDAVQAALTEQRRTGARLGETLVHRGALAPSALIAALGEQLRIPTVDAARAEPDPAAVGLLPDGLTRRLRLVPLGVDPDTLYLAVAEPLDPPAVAALREHTSLRLRQFLAEPAAVEELLRRVHGERWAAQSREELRVRFPEESASRVLTRGQARVLGLVVVAIVAAAAFQPGDTAAALVALAAVAYLALLVHRIALVARSLGRRLELEVSDERLAALDERTLPTYTVLVPLRDEARVVADLAAALDRLDYPRTKLDIRLLCDADDHSTLAAIRELGLPAHFSLVVVPVAEPRTKPRALAYGLLQARGSLVVVYDAEDRPDTDQLRRAAMAFELAGPRVACLQARLGCFNAEQNLLTRWFAAEYAAWFSLALPALGSLGAPIPLGGTSNHLRVDRLVELGGWDPYNVTEDADLGIRLHKAGLRTAVLDSTTLEEAPSDLLNWLRQRSRWSKGHAHTWLVHLRHPLRLARRTGVGGLLTINLTVGAVYVLLVSPFFWALTTLLLLGGGGPLPAVFPAPAYHLAAIALFVGNFGFAYLMVAGALQERRFSLVRSALLAPLYWGLISLAAWRGIGQLLTRPSHWEKTAHGHDHGTPLG